MATRGVRVPLRPLLLAGLVAVGGCALLYRFDDYGPSPGAGGGGGVSQGSGMASGIGGGFSTSTASTGGAGGVGGVGGIGAGGAPSGSISSVVTSSSSGSGAGGAGGAGGGSAKFCEDGGLCPAGSICCMLKDPHYCYPMACLSCCKP